MDPIQAVFRPAVMSTQTDNAGAFRFEDVSPVTYIATAKDAKQGYGVSEPIVVRPGEDAEGVTVQLHSPASLEGTVTTTQEQPVQHAEVTLYASQGFPIQDLMPGDMPGALSLEVAAATTDAAGRYTFDSLPAASYVLAVRAEGLAAIRQTGIDLSPGQAEERHVTLSRGGSVQGRLEKEGEAQQGMMVVISGTQGAQMARSNASGDFAFSNVPPGLYLLNIADPAYSTTEAEGVAHYVPPRVIEVREGEQTTVAFDESVGTTVSGSVKNREGQGALLVLLETPGATDTQNIDPMDIQSVLEALREQAGSALVNAEGAFEIKGVVPGTYTLKLVAIGTPGEAAQDQPVLLTQPVTVTEESLTLELTLEPQEASSDN
jgi:protocatechuate 3,4-dioxygenase beta subunit